MQIKVNGEIREAAEGATVSALVGMLALNPTQVAIERNRQIVPRSTYGDTLLTPGDEIEIVAFIGGG